MHKQNKERGQRLDGLRGMQVWKDVGRKPTILSKSRENNCTDAQCKTKVELVSINLIRGLLLFVMKVLNNCFCSIVRIFSLSWCTSIPGKCHRWKGDTISTTQMKEASIKSNSINWFISFEQTRKGWMGIWENNVFISIPGSLTTSLLLDWITDNLLGAVMGKTRERLPLEIHSWMLTATRLLFAEGHSEVTANKSD